MDMRRSVQAARVARLATVAADGAPHLVPVCFALIGDTVYHAVDHKPKKSRRLRRVANIEATARVSLLVDDYDEDWSRLWWVRLDGAGRVVTDEPEVSAAVAALVARYPQYRETPPAGPVIAVDIDHWSGWSAAA
jgi:PPOX class probable F420-dependent enzyme